MLARGCHVLATEKHDGTCVKVDRDPETGVMAGAQCRAMLFCSVCLTVSATHQ